jgi:hypothetical protein
LLPALRYQLLALLGALLTVDFELLRAPLALLYALLAYRLTLLRALLRLSLSPFGALPL